MPDEMDVKAVQEGLSKALAAQATSLLTMTVLAGSLRGLASVGVKEQLRTFVQAEIQETYRLTEKLSALGGTPVVGCPEISLPEDPTVALTRLVEAEERTLEALHAVIPDTGQEPHSEALEHLIEHAILRKQQQVDLIRHAIA